MRHQKSDQIIRPDGMRYDFVGICRAPRMILAQLFERGSTPKMSDISGWEYKGRNLSYISSILRIRRFTKGFLTGGAETKSRGMIDGYNVLVRQRGGPHENWVSVMKDGKPLRHGYYRVYPVRPDGRENKFPRALVLDYSLGVNPWYHPGRVLRDYLMQVYSDDPGLLIGRAYVALGSLRIFGGYFVLERAGRVGPADT